MFLSLELVQTSHGRFATFLSPLFEENVYYSFFSFSVYQRGRALLYEMVVVTTPPPPLHYKHKLTDKRSNGSSLTPNCDR